MLLVKDFADPVGDALLVDVADGAGALTDADQGSCAVEAHAAEGFLGV